MKTTPKIRTEADGTKVSDLQAYCGDSYNAYFRGEITREQYQSEVAALQKRIDALLGK